MYFKSKKHFLNGIPKQILVLFAFLFGLSVFAQVALKVDTTHIRIGEQISYEISTDIQPKVAFPKLQLDSLGKVEVVHSLPIDTLKKRLYKKYILTCFDSGRYHIPAQEILIDKQRFFTDSLLINVGTVAVDTTQQKLFPIKPIYKAPKKTWKDYLQYLWVVALITLLIALVWLIVYLLKKKEKRKAAKQIPPIEAALKQLHSLDGKQLIKKQKIKEYYIELTEIVRDYIGKDVHIPTMEVTTDELITFLEIHNKSKNIGIDKERIKVLHSFLKEADLVKFAKYIPVEKQIQQDRKVAENIVNEIQSLVHKPILDEFGNEIIIETQEEKLKKANKKQRNIALLITGAILLLSFATASWYYGFQYVKDTILGHPTKELLEGDWYHSSYGHPAVSLETPKVLKAQDLQIPAQMQQVIVSNAFFTYGSMISEFFVAVNTTEYNPEIDFNIDKAVVGAAQMVEAQPEISDFQYEVEDSSIDGKDCKLIKGTYKSNGSNRSYIQYVIEQNHMLQQVIVVHKIDDNYAKDIQKQIIKSIRLQTVEDDEEEDEK
jgi:hypothetical protein